MSTQEINPSLKEMSTRLYGDLPWFRHRYDKIISQRMVRPKGDTSNSVSLGTLFEVFAGKRGKGKSFCEMEFNVLIRELIPKSFTISVCRYRGDVRPRRA